MNELSLEKVVLILKSVEIFISLNHSFDVNNLCITIVTDSGTYKVVGFDFSSVNEIFNYIYKTSKDTIVRSLSFHIY